ncbi:hypothetical protein [Salinispora cortesiana]|uniref:hypothetical protein n=1 Tax=Salinispora cortesiana TaxID=1305843 RepID=UPI0003656D2D
MGFSAGSMVLAPRIGDGFVGWNPTGGDTALGIVGFSTFPRLEVSDCPENSTAAAEKWAAEIGVPAYATDDQTAIKVVDGVVEVLSEGHWLRYIKGKGFLRQEWTTPTPATGQSSCPDSPSTNGLGTSAQRQPLAG